MPCFGVAISQLEQKSPEKIEATSKQQNGGMNLNKSTIVVG
jgi:hypothetical protein